jgi:hypothetical protein
MTEVTAGYSTTSFKGANGLKVFLSTGSKSTGLPSVKVVSKDYQLLMRFPKP